MSSPYYGLVSQELETDLKPCTVRVLRAVLATISIWLFDVFLTTDLPSEFSSSLSSAENLVLKTPPRVWP